jgi:hypothetical protein
MQYSDDRGLRSLTRHSQYGFNRIGDAIGGFGRRPRRIRRFDSPALPRFRRGDRALSCAVVRCRCRTLISTAIAYNFKNGCDKRADLSMLRWSMLRSLLTSTLDSEPWKPAPRDM